MRTPGEQPLCLSVFCCAVSQSAALGRFASLTVRHYVVELQQLDQSYSDVVEVDDVSSRRRSPQDEKNWVQRRLRALARPIVATCAWTQSYGVGEGCPDGSNSTTDDGIGSARSHPNPTRTLMPPSPVRCLYHRRLPPEHPRHPSLPRAPSLFAYDPTV